MTSLEVRPIKTLTTWQRLHLALLRVTLDIVNIATTENQKTQQPENVSVSKSFIYCECKKINMLAPQWTEESFKNK